MASEAKRKKCYTKSDLWDKLKENEYDVKKAVEEVVKELAPFDIDDENVSLIEDRLERLEEVSKLLSAKCYKLKSELKARKYRKHPELLEEKVFSCSQHSVLQSENEDSDNLSQSMSQTSLTKKATGYEQEKSTYKKKPLNHRMTQFSRRRRVSEKRQILAGWAEEEGVNVSQLCGYFQYLENWNYDKQAAAVGWRIFTGESISERPEISLQEAVWMIEKSGMSQKVYQEIRLRFLDRIWLPPVMLVRNENKEHRPQLTIYRHGVKATLAQCLSLTITERLQQLDLSHMDTSSLQVLFQFIWGLDGSGDQSNYHQNSKVDYSTKQIMSVCFSIREMRVVDGQGNVACYSTSITGGANRPQNTRPLALFPAAENKELLEDFIPTVEAEIERVKTEGVEVTVKEDVALQAQCELARLKMADGKMVTNLLNCGGAYCTMCTKSQDDAHKKEVVEEGFIIERSVESLKELAQSLTDPATGTGVLILHVNWQRLPKFFLRQHPGKMKINLKIYF